MRDFVSIGDAECSHKPDELLRIRLSCDQLEQRESPAVIALPDFYTVRAGRTLGTVNIGGTGKFGKGATNTGVLRNDSDTNAPFNTGRFLLARLISSPVDLGTGQPIATAFQFNNKGNGSFTFRAPRNINTTVRFQYQAFNTAGESSATTNVDIRVIGPTRRIVAGADQGGAPRIQAFDSTGKTKVLDFFAFDPSFTGGVRVAAGDFNGDLVDDIVTAAGPGGGPNIRIFDGNSGQLFKDFMAFDASFRGGVQVATGDVNGDDEEDLIVAADAGGGPHVKVFTLNNNTDPQLYTEFFAYDMSFTGGVRVATGDVRSDGSIAIITAPGFGGGPHIKSFDVDDPNNVRVIHEFFAFDENRRDGANIAVGDFNGDFFDDYAVGTGSDTPEVIIRSGRNLSVFGSFVPGQQPTNPGLINVQNGNQTSLLATEDQFNPENSEAAKPSQIPLLRPSSLNPDNLKSRENTTRRPGILTPYTGGARIAVTYADRDNNADLILSVGPNEFPRVRIYAGSTGAVFHDFDVFEGEFYGGVWIAGHH